MNMGSTLAFALPVGWTLRKVATSLAREWLPPFRAVPVAKGAPWMVQPIVEDDLGEAGAPLWEPGISTEEYEERLDRSGLGWSIRAKAGRSKGTILAKLSLCAERPATLLLVCSQDSFPESLFDANKLAQFLGPNGTEGPEGLMSGLLRENGFQPAAKASTH